MSTLKSISIVIYSIQCVFFVNTASGFCWRHTISSQRITDKHIERTNPLFITSNTRPVSNQLFTPFSPVRKLHPFQRRQSGTELYFFNFGGDNKKAQDGDELFRVPTKNKTAVQNDASALTEYISSWAELFVPDAGKGMGLTTPVTVFQQGKTAVIDRPIVKFEFRATNTGYKSSKEENSENEGNGDKRKKENKQGGVEIVLEGGGPQPLYVIARRWNMDEDTMVKEMSEEVIVKKLKDALVVWEQS